MEIISPKTVAGIWVGGILCDQGTHLGQRQSSICNPSLSSDIHFNPMYQHPVCAKPWRGPWVSGTLRAQANSQAQPCSRGAQSKMKMQCLLSKNEEFHTVTVGHRGLHQARALLVAGPCMPAKATCPGGWPCARQSFRSSISECPAPSLAGNRSQVHMY